MARGRGRPFVKGQRANPKGRPPGIRNEWSEACQRGLTPELADKWFKRFSASISKGSIKALSVITRALPAPPPLQPSVKVRLPPIHSAADAGKALAAVIDAMAAGKIPLEQADAVSAIIARCADVLSKSTDIAELFEQIARLKEIATARAATPPQEDATMMPWQNGGLK